MVNIQVTRWSPDTCDCVIDYEWDKDLDASVRVHTGKNIIKDCPDHSDLGNPQDFYNAILDENQRKNKTQQELLENFVMLRDTDADGNFTFKQGIDISYFWTGTNDDRVLHLSVVGLTLTTQQKTIVQNILDNKFGEGKVLIE